METVFLHVGLPKTATTTIQVFLCKNYDSLLAEGYLYPRSFLMWDYHHHRLPMSLVDMPAFASEATDVSVIRHALTQEVSKTGAENIIVSSEFFVGPFINCQYKKQEVLIERIAEFFTDQSIVVILYLRRQDLLLESLYKQAVKSAPFLKKDILEIHFCLDYFWLLNAWEKAFSRENIRVCIFGRETINHGVVENFLSVIGLQSSTQFENPETGNNPSIRRRATVELLRLTNGIEMPPGYDRYSFNENVSILMDKQLDSKRSESLLTNLEREALLKRFEDCNKGIKDRYFNSLPTGIFSPLEQSEGGKARTTDGNEMRREIYIPEVAELLLDTWCEMQDKKP